MQLNGYKGNNMSLGGGSSSQQQLDPELKNLFTSNYQNAQNVASGLTPRQFAGFTPEQNEALATTQRFADPNGEAFNAMRESYSTLRGAAGYQPQNVSGAQLSRGTVRDVAAQNVRAAQIARGDIRDVASQDINAKNVANQALQDIVPGARASIRDVNANTFLQQNLQDYMNPYTQNVTEQGLKDIERARQLEQLNTAGRAGAAKAFGGSRQGVAEAETNRAFQDTSSRFVGEQNARAFDTASQLANLDINRMMQAQQLNQGQDAAVTQQALNLSGQFGMANQEQALRAYLANQGVDLSTATTNAQLSQQAKLANQEQALRASLANQGYDFNVGQLNTQNIQQANLANQGAGLTANQQRIGAGTNMANTARTFQDMGLTGANALNTIAGQRQAFSQQQLDAIRNLPLEQQQILNQALGINVGGGSGQTSTSTSRQGLLGLLGIG